MLFSNTDIPEFNFTFNERTIPITNSHKHLGVTISSDGRRTYYTMAKRYPRVIRSRKWKKDILYNGQKIPKG
jgi:hypothetical protein